MVKQTIQIYCRLKPTKSTKKSVTINFDVLKFKRFKLVHILFLFFEHIKIYELENKESNDLITFSVPKDAAEGFINNKKEEYRFRFERIFNPDTVQDDIFNTVAEPVIDK
jgi:kinesin family protein 6/9